jgi:hypothetical protein
MMPFDVQEIFANLAEKEKIKGHHSAEGRAIRTLSRGLSGWSAGNLSARDVIALCDQSVEDWLKARLRLSSWSAKTLPALLVAAISHDLITHTEAARLQGVRNLRERADEQLEISTPEVEAALEFCVRVIERHW